MVFTHDCAVRGLEYSHIHWGGVFAYERERACCMGVGVTEPSIPVPEL